MPLPMLETQAGLFFALPVQSPPARFCRSRSAAENSRRNAVFVPPPPLGTPCAAAATAGGSGCVVFRVASVSSPPRSVLSLPLPLPRIRVAILF